MAESVTISRKQPDFKSMRYNFLREEGLRHIQDLAGRVWTDFNTHDPGVTILEVLSYAITDLGYRTSFDIKDLITLDPNDPDAVAIQNFFTACEILPNCPVTFNDYRKLLMDVDVHDASNPDCEFAGIKNAWIQKAGASECPFYVHTLEDKLSLEPDPNVPNQEPIVPGILYDILIEFNSCDSFGDLNESFLRDDLTIYEHPLDTSLEGLRIRVIVDFPRWDQQDVDWEDLDSIKSNIRGITLLFFDVPDGYTFEYLVTEENDVLLSGIKESGGPGGIAPVPGLIDIATAINDFIYDTTTGLIVQYQAKIDKILEIIAEARARLMANRNLCEDFFRLNAIRVEEIAVCADIELTTDANVEEVQAQIYHEITKFLSPTVFFYTLQEMFDKGFTSSQIFEGPKLLHGFIDNEELSKADCPEILHVSDLIQIIMDVEGVVAVKDIQIANLPQDNDQNIASVSVNWCLSLACDKNYVPRLSNDSSKLTFYKENLPFKADELEVEALIDELEDAEREQKIHPYPFLDIEVPAGEFKDLEDYVSIQEEFPLVYGIGTDGLSPSASDLRKAQAKQLKGFLMFFDQLLANYLSQLAHVKDLFSMNQNKNTQGQYEVDRSYFTQPLFDIVPDSDPLYVDEAGHAAALNAIAEDEQGFEVRRNKFLDHMMARFGEQFTDYALLSYKLSGAKASGELIEDKLKFLNSYPKISKSRGKAFNYMDPCELWHVNNVAGVIDRVSLITGIDERLASTLFFRENFAVTSATGGVAPFGFTVSDLGATGSPVILQSVVDYDTEALAKEAIERAIVNGVCRERYEIVAEATGTFVYQLFCDDVVLAVSTETYSSEAEAEAAIDEAILVFKDEFYNNPESNRKNLACPIENYFDIKITTDLTPGTGENPTYTISFTLYEAPFDFGTGNTVLLTGSYTGEGEIGDSEEDLIALAEAKQHDVLWTLITNAIIRDHYLFENGVGGYVFNVVDRLCDVLATSAETDFNMAVADEIENQLNNVPATVTVTNSTANDGTYEVISATASGAKIVVDVDLGTGVDLSPVFDGNLSFMENFMVTGIFPDIHTFMIAEDLTGRLEAGDAITISNSTSNDGIYTVISIDYTGSGTDIVVEEVIPSDAVIDGDLSYNKSYPIVGIQTGTGTDAFVIKGGGDERAVDRMIAFFTDKFFSHEGMHLIEHILLRPKVKEDLLQDVTIETLKEPGTGESAGDVAFVKVVTIVSSDSAAKTFTVEGDITGDLTPGLTITVADSPDLINDRDYTLTSTFSYDGGTDTTTLKVLQPVSADTSNTGGNGDLSYTKLEEITDVDAANRQVTLGSIDILGYVTSGDEIRITGSENEVNDARYIVESITNNGGLAEIVLDQKLTEIRDDLLPINLTDDCDDCRLEDPYTCVVSVIMPYWQGRFINQDFRKFFERTIRLEAPVHTVLNVCWVSCEHMTEYELKLKRWLVENAKITKNKVKLSETLNDLIDILTRLRTVYPVGRLHDCEEEPDNFSGSVILDQSQLGII